MDSILRVIKKFIPKTLFVRLQPTYHYILAFTSALLYRFPSRKLYVIAVTGTKGKSSTAELINAILEKAGYMTAVADTIRFKIGVSSERNLYKMTMPGRFFMQRFLRRAVSSGTTHVVIEMTSEGAKLYRHAFIELDALIFTNLSPEHIESHGSFEKYLGAKLRLRDRLVHSHKERKAVIANIDDPHGKDFLAVGSGVTQVSYSLSDAANAKGTPAISFSYGGEVYTSPLQGEFNIYNILAAIKLAEYLGIKKETVRDALAAFSTIPGRVEYVRAGQPFSVIVDYAHTPDSLEQLYKAFEGKKKICVLGNTGGGRDTWKRPAMGALAETYCDMVILTDEDPYDEDPRSIIEDMTAGMKKKPTVIMDRREAIYTACLNAQRDDVVLITGKGTDPYIMRANGAKEVWSDRTVAEEELKKLLTNEQR